MAFDRDIQDRLETLVSDPEIQRPDFWTQFDNLIEVIGLAKFGRQGELQDAILIKSTGGPHVELHTRTNRIYAYHAGQNAEHLITVDMKHAILDHYKEIWRLLPE
ncbi:hypothetical protein C6499_19065 [Candidatus Poribacteria bacterium]|nr:MAG: hypothetical protein C6499_19065 [Candidatus Poribacteria bacterium]